MLGKRTVQGYRVIIKTTSQLHMYTHRFMRTSGIGKGHNLYIWFASLHRFKWTLLFNFRIISADGDFEGPLWSFSAQPGGDDQSSEWQQRTTHKTPPKLTQRVHTHTGYLQLLGFRSPGILLESLFFANGYWYKHFRVGTNSTQMVHTSLTLRWLVHIYASCFKLCPWAWGLLVVFAS